jgi:hypothetical protein
VGKEHIRNLMIMGKSSFKEFDGNYRFFTTFSGPTMRHSWAFLSYISPEKGHKRKKVF